MELSNMTSKKKLTVHSIDNLPLIGKDWREYLDLIRNLQGPLDMSGRYEKEYEESIHDPEMPVRSGE
jgi:hypothetical protein